MGIQEMLSSAVQKGLIKHAERKKANREVREGVTKKKKTQRQPYEEENKVKRKKVKKIALTPLVPNAEKKAKRLKAKLEDPADGGKLTVASKKSKKPVKGAKAAARPVAKKATPVKRKQKRPSAHSPSDHEMNPLAPYLPTQQELDRLTAQRAIQGSATTAAFEPLEDLGLPTSTFMREYAASKQVEGRDESELLKKAHDYFGQLNRDERRRNALAMRRIKDMKTVNRRGGDKDGFKYVVPKNVSTVVRQIMVAEGVEGAQVDPESLESTFGGDGVKESAAKPMRSHKQRNHCFDDFYQFQVAKKWTKNAESFLSRGRAGKNLFAARQLRTIKKM